MAKLKFVFLKGFKIDTTGMLAHAKTPSVFSSQLRQVDLECCRLLASSIEMGP